MFFHLDEFCGRPVFIVARNTGIMCWGYSLSLRRPCLCNITVSPRPRAVKHTLNHPCNPCSQQRTVTARCYNLNLYFVADWDDLTEKNKRICLDLQLYPSRKLVCTLKFSNHMATYFGSKCTFVSDKGSSLVSFTHTKFCEMSVFFSWKLFNIVILIFKMFLAFNFPFYCTLLWNQKSLICMQYTQFCCLCLETYFKMLCYLII